MSNCFICKLPILDFRLCEICYIERNVKGQTKDRLDSQLKYWTKQLDYQQQTHEPAIYNIEKIIENILEELNK